MMDKPSALAFATVQPPPAQCQACGGLGRLRLLGKSTTLTVTCPRCRAPAQAWPALSVPTAPGIAWHLLCELRSRGASDEGAAEAVAALQHAFVDGGWAALDHAIVQALEALEREP